MHFTSPPGTEEKHVHTRIIGTIKMRVKHIRPSDEAPVQHQVHVVTALPPKPCETVTGGYINTLSLKNKQDYAALKPGFRFHWNMGVANKNLTG